MANINLAIYDSAIIQEGLTLDETPKQVEIYDTASVSDRVVPNLPIFGVRNPDLDLYFDCLGNDTAGNPDVGVLSVLTEISGDWLNRTVISDPIEITTEISGTWISGIVINADPFEVTTSIQSDGITLTSVGMGWIQWSNIGNLDFTIWKDNIAGKRPLDWRGTVYKVAKLGKKVVVYGSGGVTLLHPSGPLFGIETILRYGIDGKNAFCGNESGHYFIDVFGCLWSLAEKLECLDYSEYLSLMTNPVMSYDESAELIYICDGTIGYVYSTSVGSLASGPVNVSGITYQLGTLYTVAPAAISIPNFNFCSDIQDMGTRKNKTIYSLEVGTDLTTYLEASIDFRIINNAAFTNIGWFPVTREGIAYTPCFGQDFKFRLRSNTYQYFEIDYIKVNGIIHNFSNTDYLGRGEVL